MNQQNDRIRLPSTKNCFIFASCEWQTCPAFVEKSNPIAQADAQRTAVRIGFLTVIKRESFNEVITPSRVPNIEPKKKKIFVIKKILGTSLVFGVTSFSF